MPSSHPSYNELLATGIFSTEENCCQYLLDMKILPTKRRCPSCSNRMELRSCSTTKYREGSCWRCPCSRTTSVRTDSVLQNTIEGTWTHAKQAVGLRRGGRRSIDALELDLTFYMWMKQHGLTRIRNSARNIFSKHIPQLLNYRRFYDI